MLRSIISNRSKSVFNSTTQQLFLCTFSSKSSKKTNSSPTTIKFNRTKEVNDHILETGQSSSSPLTYNSSKIAEQKSRESREVYHEPSSTTITFNKSKGYDRDQNNNNNYEDGYDEIENRSNSRSRSTPPEFKDGLDYQQSPSSMSFDGHRGEGGRRTRSSSSSSSPSFRNSSNSSRGGSSNYNKKNDKKYEYQRKMDQITHDQKEKFQIEGEALFGFNPIWIALFANNRSFNCLYILDTMFSKLNFNKPLVVDKAEEVQLFDQDEDTNRYSDKKNVKALKEILKYCKELKVPVHPVKKQLLDTFSKWNVHNGMVLDCSPLTAESIDRLQVIDKEAMSKLKSPPLVVALDEIWDPQNTGAIIRSCHFFGVSGVVTTDKHSSPLSPVASKASSGALEDTPIYKTMSLVGFLKGSKENGWRVIGTSLGENSKPIQEVSLDKPTILVIGNEGFGISENILAECDQVVKIPVSPKANPKLESLNASVSAGIMIHHLLNK